jgi:hypothetical protein
MTNYTAQQLIDLLLEDPSFSEVLNEAHSMSELWCSAVETVGYLIGPGQAEILREALDSLTTQL